MSKINLLPSKIYNRIAAGEVVENPASVVKELVENSIDAGASRISIEIIDGGITEIVVIDNGCGIEKSELKKALLPHATSKISKLEDLDAISTLGFRGEALASIASISKLSISSKTCNSEFGYQIQSIGGDISNVTECAIPFGTEIRVNNLFYNTPAREKFLKKPKSEENNVTNIVSKLILGNHNIAIKYTANGKVVYNSYGDGLENAMTAIYGIDAIKNCFNIDTIKNGLVIKGYIGKHHYTKASRAYQSIFINNRYVNNQTIASSIHNAYSSYLMKRQYPFYVINLEIPSEFIDVNVHPNKTDVRFSNNEIIYGAFYSIISKVLDGSSEIVNIIKDTNVKSIENIDKTPDDYATHKSDNEQFKETFKFDKLIFSDSKPAPITETTKSIFEENKEYLKSLENKNVNVLSQPNNIQQEIFVKKDIKYIGQIFNTYLVFECDDYMLLADQHAAHERLLYDKFVLQLNERKIDIQPLLLPYIINLNASEYDYIFSKSNVLSELGIDIEPFGDNSFKVSTIPALLNDISLDNFFNTLISDILELKEIKLDSLLKEKLAQNACKSAIKAGNVLTNLEIEKLTEYLEKNQGLKCPHGRPVTIKISKTEIEKWFKRIV